jgi:hypothetical protein
MNKWWTVSAFSMTPLAFYSFVAAGADPLANGPGPTVPPPTVVILGPESSDDVTTQAMARVNGELKAAGFEVVILPLSGGDPRRDLETAGRDLHPLAAFAIFVKRWEAGSSVAEIWVSDRIKHQTIIQNAVLDDADRGRGSEILAVRAVEILKARLADFWAPDVPTRSAVPIATATRLPPPAREAEETPRIPFAAGVGGGVGVGVMDSFDAAPVTWAPQAMVFYGWADGLSLRASFHGLGPAMTLSTTLPQTDPVPLTATVRVERQIAMIEAVKTWWPRWALVPFVCAGAGAQHLHIVGSSPSSLLQGHTRDEWALLTTIGTGIGVPMLFGLSLLIQARGVASWPPTAVAVRGPNGARAEAGRIGTPSLLVDGAVLGVFP